MAGNSIVCRGIVALRSSAPVSVSERRCSVGRLFARSSCRVLQQSRGASSASRQRIQVTASSGLDGSVSLLDHDALPTEGSLSAVEGNEYIGYGRLLADCTFRERFVIRFSEVSSRGKISLETLSSLLQEAASNHVVEMDFNFTPGKNMNGKITVTTRMHIEVDRYPEWRDLIEIDTWFQPEGKNSVRRDWIVKDVKTGENIAFATSTWVLMNIETRRLCKITEEIWQELDPHMMKGPFKWALSEERRKESSIKIAKLDEERGLKIEGVVATEKDCDMNQHVNNVKYLGWMIEAVPEEIKRSHEISKITIEYRQEASHGEYIDTVVHMENTESSDVKCFTHLTLKSDDGKEVNRGRSVWRTS